MHAWKLVFSDVLTDFGDPESEAHLLVATGTFIDEARGNAVVIHYSDPLTGTREAAA